MPLHDDLIMQFSYVGIIGIQKSPFEIPQKHFQTPIISQSSLHLFKTPNTQKSTEKNLNSLLG